MVTTPNYDLDVDTTLGGNDASDYIIPSQKAIKAYVDNNTGSTVDQTYDPTSQAAQSGVAMAGELTKYAQKAVDTDITGVYNFKGQKKIKFTQSSSSDKLGFTLYNNSNVEKGYLEYNPSNTVDSVPLMTLGNYASSSAGLTHVGFRKYSSVSGASGAYNLLAPLISDAKTPFNLTTTYTNFYLPLGFTDGNTTVKAAKSGLVDISTLLPDVSNFVTNTSLATTLADYTLSSSLATVATSGSYNDLSNKPTIPDAQVQADWDVTDTTSKAYIKNKPYIPSGVVIDQTYDGTSTNAQSGVAIAGELTNYIDKTTNQTISSDKTFSSSSTLYFRNTSSIECGSGCGVHDITDFWFRGQSTYWNYPRSIVNDNNGIAITKQGITTKTDLIIDGYKIFDGGTGLIPDARISTNIARTSQIPTVPSNISAFTNDSGYLSTVTYNSATETLTLS